MVDRLDFFSQGKIVSGLTIDPRNILVADGRLTAAGIIEHMAQTIAMHKGYTYYLEDKSAPLGYIGAIKKVEIIALPLAKESLTTTVTILHDIMGVTLVETETAYRGAVIAFGQMKTALA